MSTVRTLPQLLSRLLGAWSLRGNVSLLQLPQIRSPRSFLPAETPFLPSPTELRLSHEEDDTTSQTDPVYVIPFA